MGRNVSLRFVALFGALIAPACGGGGDARPDAGARRDVGFFTPRDTGILPDTGVARDVETVDLGFEPDLGFEDADPVDVGLDDTPIIDMSVDDTGFEPDLGLNDTGVMDTGDFDAGFPDADPPDITPPDTGMADAGVFTQAGTVFVSEFLARSSGAEWIEVHNTGAAPVTLTAYTVSIFSQATIGSLAIRAASDPTGAAGTAVTLAPGAYAIGYFNPANAAQIPANATFVIGTPGQAPANTLSDGGDMITLISSNGMGDRLDFRAAAVNPSTPIAAAEFPLVTDVPTSLDPASDAGSGVTANDNGGVWCVQSFRGGTPGALNRSCTAFVISEFLYDYDSVTTGTDDGQEFVEIAGPGGGSMANVVLTRVEGSGAPAGTVDGETAIPIGTRMPLDGFWVIADDDPTGSGMTRVPNADQILNLVAENGPDAYQLVRMTELLDAVAYGAVTAATDLSRSLAIVEGTPVGDWATGIYSMSFARADNEADTNNNSADFRYDPSPTPGARNGASTFALLSLSPDDGVSTPGATITTTLAGSDFHDNMTVVFGGTPAPAVSCATPDRVNRLTCTITYPAAGSGNAERVNVTVNGRTEVPVSSTLMNGFTWTNDNNESGVAAECDFCNLQFPVTLTASARQSTAPIYGQIFEAGRTDTTMGGAAPGITAEIGYGASGSDPRNVNWVWFPATFNVETGVNNNNDEYRGTIVAPAPGTYSYTYRFSLDGGLNWTYADVGGAGSNPTLDFSPAAVGVMTVQ